MSIRKELNNPSANIYSTELLEKKIKLLQKIIDKYESKQLNEYSINDLIEIDYIGLQISFSTRLAMDESQDISIDTLDINKQKIDYKALENIPVDVNFENGILTVYTPYLFRRAFGKDYTARNFAVANYVSLALKKWLIDNKKYDDYCEYFNENMDTKMSVIVTRYSKKFSRTVVCDNDNIENGRVINAIFETIFRSDNAKNMDFVSRYRTTDDDTKYGTEFKVVPTDKLKEYL